MAKKNVAAGKATRARRAAAALVAVLALSAGALWTVPAGTTTDLDGGSEAPTLAGPDAGFRQAPAGVGHPGGSGRVADGGDLSGSALRQSATDSRSPSIVGDGQVVGRERVAGGGRVLGQSATDSRSPTLE